MGSEEQGKEKKRNGFAFGLSLAGFVLLTLGGWLIGESYDEGSSGAIIGAGAGAGLGYLINKD